MKKSKRKGVIKQVVRDLTYSIVSFMYLILSLLAFYQIGFTISLILLGLFALASILMMLSFFLGNQPYKTYLATFIGSFFLSVGVFFNIAKLISMINNKYLTEILIMGTILVIGYAPILVNHILFKTRKSYVSRLSMYVIALTMLLIDYFLTVFEGGTSPLQSAVWIILLVDNIIQLVMKEVSNRLVEE